MKSIIIFIIPLTILIIIYGQNNENYYQERNEDFVNETDTFKLDTISILTNSNLSPLILCLENAELKESKNIADIPVFIREALNNWTTDNFSIANKGENWQATDVVSEKGLPKRKLIYLGIGEDISLISYYIGGIGVSERILIIRHNNENIIDFWCGYSFKDHKSKEEIIEYLKNNKDKKWGLNTNVIYL